MTQKIVAAACLLVAAIFGVIAFDPLGLVDFDFRNGLTHRNGFVELVSEDLYHMKKKNLLPPAWDSIQYIAYNFHSDVQRKLVGHRKFKINDDPQGKYRLEIEFIDVPDDTDPAIILQMSLFDLASNNKIFELGRTHSISSFLVKEKKKEVPAKAADKPAAAASPENPPPAAPQKPAEKQAAPVVTH